MTNNEKPIRFDSWLPRRFRGVGANPPWPGVLFREDWNHKEPFEEVSQADVANPNLIQTLYGPGGKSVKKRHHGTDDDPYYIWSGACPANWALTLQHKQY